MRTGGTGLPAVRTQLFLTFRTLGHAIPVNNDPVEVSAPGPADARIFVLEDHHEIVVEAILGRNALVPRIVALQQLPFRTGLGFDAVSAEQSLPLEATFNALTPLPMRSRRARIETDAVYAFLISGAGRNTDTV